MTELSSVTESDKFSFFSSIEVLESFLLNCCDFLITCPCALDDTEKCQKVHENKCSSIDENRMFLYNILYPPDNNIVYSENDHHDSFKIIEDLDDSERRHLCEYVDRINRKEVYSPDYKPKKKEVLELKTLLPSASGLNRQVRISKYVW